MQSLSWERQNRASKRKALPAGWLKSYPVKKDKYINSVVMVQLGELKKKPKQKT